MWIDPRYHDDAGHFAECDAITVNPDDIAPPFKVRRVYFIYDTLSDVVRGRHAHRCLRQLCVCPSGSCVFDLDDGARRWSVKLDHPTKGLLIGPLTWREMRDFTPDCVLVVLADQEYDQADYIRDYAEFTKVVAAG